MTHQSPKAVKRSAAWADRQIALNARQLALYPRPGRPRTKKKAKGLTPGLMFADTIEEANRQQTILDAVLGPRAKGNKRLGKAGLYFDLTNCFLDLDRRGIRPPCSGSLSLRAFENGVAAVLLKHGEITAQEVRLGLKRGDIRVQIGRRLKAQFSQVSLAIRKTTP